MNKVILAIPFIWLFLTCMNNYGTHTGSESCGGTTDETVVRTGAIIYEQDGKTPARDAIVKIFKSDAIDGQYIFLQITDSEGRYFLNGLEPGIFNVWVEKDSMVAFQDSVCISVSGATLQNDTLDCASSLSGFTVLQPLLDPSLLTIQVIGTDKQINDIDSSGHFILRGLAGGTYSLFLKSEIVVCMPTILKVNVRDCASDTLKDTVRVFDNDKILWISALRAPSNVSDKFSHINLQLENMTFSKNGSSLYHPQHSNPESISNHLTSSIRIKSP